jgi:hypothetical protein
VLLRVKPGEARVVWSDAEKRRDKSMQTHWNTPIHHEGYLYASSGRHTENAELRCVELTTGKVMWSEPNLTRSSLLYVDGHFVCLGEDGTARQSTQVRPRGPGCAAGRRRRARSV